MTEFIGKQILVTGAASGIGRAQALAFAKQGAKVLGVDKANYHTDAFDYLQLDLTQALDPLFERLPYCDILCNTAGVLDDFKPLLDISEQDFLEVFNINLFSSIKLIRHYLPSMVARHDGVIINMASIASLLAGGGGAAYTASKHAIAGLTKQLALDYAASGIQIIGIAPGAVKTPMNARDFTEDNGAMAKWVAENTPIGRWSEPEEVADLTLFLASRKAQSLQGQIIPIDGGWTIK